MPETRVEKSLFVLGVLAIAALGFLVAHLWHHSRGAAAPAATSSSVLTRTSSGTASTGRDVTTASRTSSTTVAPNTRPATTLATTSSSPTPVRAVSLLLTARTDTWLEVRSGSSAGSILYSGTLAAGATKAFRAKFIWARFGAAGNLSARFNRKPFHLPSGTYDAAFDGHGFRKLGA